MSYTPKTGDSLRPLAGWTPLDITTAGLDGASENPVVYCGTNGIVVSDIDGNFIRVNASTGAIVTPVQQFDVGVATALAWDGTRIIVIADAFGVYRYALDGTTAISSGTIASAHGAFYSSSNLYTYTNNVPLTVKRYAETINWTTPVATETIARPCPTPAPGVFGNMCEAWGGYLFALPDSGQYGGPSGLMWYATLGATDGVNIPISGIDVSMGVFGVAFDGTYVWVTDAADNLLSKLDVVLGAAGGGRLSTGIGIGL